MHSHTFIIGYKTNVGYIYVLFWCTYVDSREVLSVALKLQGIHIKCIIGLVWFDVLGVTVKFEGAWPECCISSMIYSRDTPFWSETLKLIYGRMWVLLFSLLIFIEIKLSTCRSKQV